MRQHSKDEFSYLKNACFDQETLRYKCGLCYHKLDRFSVLVNHMRMHHNGEEDFLKNDYYAILKNECLSYSCPECEKKFISENSTLTHRVLEHYAVTDKSCSHCGLKFLTHGGAIKHRKNIHGDELPLMKVAFKEAEKVCSSEKCKRKFFTAGCLEYHRRRNHSPKLRKSQGKGKVKNEVQT